MKIIARARCGNTDEWNKYWDKEETRKCMLCERGRATLKHWLEDCEKIERGEMTERRILHERGNAEVVEWLRKLDRKKRERGERGKRDRLSDKRISEKCTRYKIKIKRKKRVMRARMKRKGE